MSDPTRLYTQLQNTGLQNKDFPLYQLIKTIIDQLVAEQNQINGITTGSTGATGPTGATGAQGPPGMDGADGEDHYIFIP